ncbi:TetR/AcrR family transcriptional regulator [Kurthia huakuii]|uniref:TetR/AcrR family transcriptional regulator n=1 Tax=Kurthia huakuii TaxID=1421019 RepID=UPI000496D8A5|nr:TetR/AcrR family transcriptional regulator [Kurthia huakuii]MBM7701002.1 AcrR family transcriptional regulator [Kurthia huakuii]
MNNRKRQIIQACVKLFSEKGFIETSIQEIIEEAQISKGTFYNYFPSKKDCLIAILDIGRKETTVRKVKAITGKEKNDKSVLAVQLIASMQVNHEHNLLPIFESILHSGDKDLKRLVDQTLLQEIDWTARRLLDVYGVKLVPYHVDASILLFGMMHQYFHIGKIINYPRGNAMDFVTFALDQLDAITPSLIAKQKTMLGPNFEDFMHEHIEARDINKGELIKQLNGFKSYLKDLTTQQEEYITYLLEELERDEPRYHVTSAVAFQFHNSFRDTPHAPEAIEITNQIWQLAKESQRH